MENVSDMKKLALILFDEDGCTAVVDTKKLKSEGTDQSIRQSSICILGTAVGPEYKVEVLEMSDSKMELNRFEKTWSTSLRSLALDEAKRSGSLTGGFLSIWPDEQVETHGNETSSDNQAVRRKETGQHQSARVAKRCRGPEMTKGQERKRQKKSSETNRSSNTINGTNNRKVTVLFEGGGEYSRQGARPERSPFYLDHLCDDERDILILQVAEHKAGNRSYGTQTSKVVVMESEEEVRKLVQKDSAESSAECLCKEVVQDVKIVKNTVQENSVRLRNLEDAVGKLTRLMEEKHNSSALSGLLEQLIPVETHDKEIQPREETTEERTSEFEIVDTGVNENLVITLPEVRRSPLLVQGPKTCFTNPCSAGHIVEVSGSSVPEGDVEIRVHQDVQRKFRQSSCSLGNFGWQLAKVLYSQEEMVGRNYFGKKGKDILSPRRVHAIEHAAVDMYGEGENTKELSKAINTGIRNLNRPPLFRLPSVQNSMV